MPNSGRGIPSGGADFKPTVKISDPELFPLKRTAGTKMEKKLKEGLSSDLLNLGSISKGSPMTILIDLLTDRSLVWLSSERPY